MGESLRNKTVNSVMWSAIERFSVQGVQFILTIIIARLVLPSDYGLVAMLGIFLAIAQVFIDSGFSNALIQRQDRTEVDFSTVFYFNIVVGIVAYVLLYISSSYIASFYNEAKLELLTKIIGLNLIISSFSVVQRAKLTIVLNFRIQALISLIAVFISGVVGICLAYKGYGVWAIAVQALLNNFLSVVLLWILVRWIPQFCFSKASFLKLFGFGAKLLLANLLNIIYLNIYSLVIGKRFSAESLGFYNRASTIVQFPSLNISNIINRVLYPVFCEIQDDNEKLLQSYRRSIRMTAYCVFPLMTTLLCLSKSFVYVVLGEKWLPSGELLQILCLAYFLTPIMILMVQILNIKGRSDYSLQAEFYKKGSSFLILFATISFGVKAMCWGLVFYSICDFLIMTFFIRKIFSGITFKEHLNLLLPILLICILIAIIISLVSLIILNPVYKILIGGFIAVISLWGFSFIFKLPEYIFVKQLISKYLKGKSNDT